MALPVHPNSISARQILDELGEANPFVINNSAERKLAGKTTVNSTIKFSDFHGKSRTNARLYVQYSQYCLGFILNDMGDLTPKNFGQGVLDMFYAITDTTVSFHLRERNSTGSRNYRITFPEYSTTPFTTYLRLNYNETKYFSLRYAETGSLYNWLGNRQNQWVDVFIELV